jgi:hypothetical protein
MGATLSTYAADRLLPLPDAPLSSFDSLKRDIQQANLELDALAANIHTVASSEGAAKKSYRELVEASRLLADERARCVAESQIVQSRLDATLTALHAAEDDMDVVTERALEIAHAFRARAASREAFHQCALAQVSSTRRVVDAAESSLRLIDLLVEKSSESSRIVARERETMLKKARAATSESILYEARQHLYDSKVLAQGAVDAASAALESKLIGRRERNDAEKTADDEIAVAAANLAAAKVAADTSTVEFAAARAQEAIASESHSRSEEELHAFAHDHGSGDDTT